MTKAQAAKIKQLSPLVDMIRAKCYDCSAGSSYEIKHCVCTNCPLYPVRGGIANFTRGNSSEGVQNVSEEEAE